MQENMHMKRGLSMGTTKIKNEERKELCHGMKSGLQPRVSESGDEQEDHPTCDLSSSKGSVLTQAGTQVTDGETEAH